MFSTLTVEEWAAGLDAVVTEILEAARLYAPPVDAIALAQTLGLTVALDDCQQGRARYVRLRGHRGGPPRPAILLRSDSRAERRHWAVAHEIGEHVAHRVFRVLDVDPRTVSPAIREAVANQMAGRLLLPTAWFAPAAAATDWDLAALKARFSTASHELIARRTLELPSPAIVTVFDQGRLTWRRGNVPGRVPPLSPEEIRCWNAVHREGRPRHAAHAAGRIRGWPVHEPGWKREILRTEIAWEWA
jgi:hypothetical protein